MDFLTDENIAASVVRHLRSKNHKITDIKAERLFGADDFKILDIASKENMVIITHDKDFANISRNRKVSHKGIVIIRLLNQNPKNVIEKLDLLLNTLSADKIKNSIITIKEDRFEIETSY